MFLCRFHHPDRGARLGLVADGALYDIGERWPTLADLLRWSAGRSNLASALSELARAGAPLAQLADVAVPPDPGRIHLLKPTDDQEVWAAGVTYERSESNQSYRQRPSG